jgi:Nickel responsive protein SCO4226-like
LTDRAHRANASTKEMIMAMRKFIIERDIPKVGTLEREQLRGAAAKSNEVLRKLGPDIQWQESYVADDKTFCVYLAVDEQIIRKHAEMSGFPATKITEVRKMIDPTTERTG